MLPFSDEVISFIVQLTQYGTTEKLRAAIAQNAEVLSFAAPQLPHSQSSDQAKGDERENNEGITVGADALATSAAPPDRVPFVAICEVTHGSPGGGESSLIATTDPASFFRTVGFARGTRMLGEATVEETAMIAGADTHNMAQGLSCILIEKRNPSGDRSGRRATSVLTLRDLYIQSMDLRRPFDALQTILRNIYDPLLRSHKTPSALRTRVQDLLTGIYSLHHTLPEIDVTRYVHEDLLQLCDTNPFLDVPQLMDRLGEAARDPSFIRRVLQVRNRCIDVLSMEPLLSGKLEEAELAKKQQNTDNAQHVASSGPAAEGLQGSGEERQTPHAFFSSTTAARTPHEKEEDEEGGWAVQERLLYWQSVQVWMEDVLKQLRGREWRLVHRVLAQRVETDYELEYMGYVKRVQEYITFLNTIPEKQLASVNHMREFNTAVDEILVAATQPTRLAPRLQLNLLTALVSQIAQRWVVVMETQPLLQLHGNPAFVPSSSAADPGFGLRSADVTVAATRTDPLVPLQTLRVAIDSLRTLQARYIRSSSALQQEIRLVHIPRAGAGHPWVEALLVRCVAIRQMIEEQLLLVRQLDLVFSTQLRQQFRTAHQNITTSLTGPPSLPLQHQPGEEYSLAMQDAYNAFVRTISGSANDSKILADPHRDGSEDSTRVSLGAAPPRYGKRESFIWRTNPTAVRRFNAAVQEYQRKRSNCDDQIAVMVSQLLSNQQHAYYNGPEEVTAASTANFMGVTASNCAMVKATSPLHYADSHGLRLFRTFKSFKLLPLEKVQRVVSGYQEAVAEKLGAYVSYLQDCYVNATLTKQEVSYNMARFSVSTLVAQIMWEQRLAKALTDSMVRFDYVNERGWHQLLYLRNVEHYWRLDERLAEFIGVPLDQLIGDKFTYDSEVHGCAVALACLNLHYAEEVSGWQQDEFLCVAQDLVASREPRSLALARDRLLIGGAPRLYKMAARVRDIRSSRDIIQQRIAAHTIGWCEEVERLILCCPMDQQSHLLAGPVLRAVNGELKGTSYATTTAAHTAAGSAVALDALVANRPLPTSGAPTGSFAINAGHTFRSGANNLSFSSSLVPCSARRSASPPWPQGDAPGGLLVPAAMTATAPSWMIEVSFPWSFPTLAEDLRFLESAHLTSIAPDGYTVDEVTRASQGGTSADSRSPSPPPCNPVPAMGLSSLRDALRSNESRSRLAHTLVELMHVYYATVNGEDASLVLLVTTEYKMVNSMLQRGIALHWNDEGVLSYVQQLSDTMQAFTTTVQQVRAKTELIHRKIRAFHIRAFHPEAIVQRVTALRRIVDSLALRCVHAHLWTRQIEPLLENALLAQMKFLMHAWTEDFLSMRGDVRFIERAAETNVFRLTPLRVRMRVIYKEVRLESSCSAWRQHWISELNRFLSWIDILPRLYKEEETHADVDSIISALGSDPVHTAGALPHSSRRGSTIMSPIAVRGGARDGNGAAMLSHSADTGGAAGEDGYQYLLLRLPASVLAEPLQAIEKCIQDAMETEKEWRRGQQFLSMDVALMQQRFGRDLRRWGRALRLMHTVTSRIMDYTQPNKLLGGIVILAQEAQIELGRKLDQVSQYAHAKFKDILQEEQEKAFQIITQSRAKVDGLNVISSAKEAALFLSESPRLQSELQRLDGDITLMDDGEVILQKLGHVFPEHWMYAAAVRKEYVSLLELVQRKMNAVQVRRPFLLEEARKDTEALEEKVAELGERLLSIDSIAVAKQAPALAKQMVTDIYHQAVALNDEATHVSATQEALGETPHPFIFLQKLLGDATRLKDVWGHVAAAYVELNALGAIPFFEMVPRRLHERLQSIEVQIDGYPESVRAFQLYRNLVGKLRRALSYNRLMQDLRSDAMSPLERSLRHWTALQQKLRLTWVLPSLTVANVWDSDPGTNAAIYAEIVEMAQGERRIEVQLDNITNYWNAFEFSVTAYKQQVVLLRGWDDVLAKLSEDLSTFGGMRASPYFVAPQLISMTNDAEGRLERLRQVLETLLEVQKRWVYLDGIFAGNVEVRVQLPHETIKFDRTSRELLHILPHTRSSGGLPEVRISFFLEDEKLLATLERLLTQLSGVQRGLTSYLDTQRSRFPRFFFIGDEDLLEIMGNSKNPLFLNKHLKKMFTALASLQLDGTVKETTTRICGFANTQGEELSLRPGPIAFRQRPMHEWLGEAERGIAFTLRESTLEVYRELGNCHDTSPYALLSSIKWMRQKPTQVLCLALQLLWVNQQGELLRGAHNSNNIHRSDSSAASPMSHAKEPAVSSSAATKSMEDLLTRLASSAQENAFEPIARHRCEQLITIAVYQRDASRVLAGLQVASDDDFDWLRILRLYVVPTNHRRRSRRESTNVDDSTPHEIDGEECVDEGETGSTTYHSTETIECRMADAVVLHGFEYIGTYERLVQTTLTDRCYLTLMQALHTRLGGSPVGPAGTGKTETVKALGMQLGRHVLVFNCDDTFDYQAVSRIFLGLCQVGAWGCFDEFNRLEERILSALSLQIQVIQQSLRSEQRQVQLNHRTVPLHVNVAIFITMNPGYAGRSKLPGNLKQLFRTVTMTIPDRETIAEVMLFAQGFTTAEALSQKVVPLFRLCEEQFTRQAHYDFGLRALKSVLVTAGDRKRLAVSEGAGTSGSGPRCTSDAVEETEQTMLLESVMSTLEPKLVTQDATLFYPLLRDFFPGTSLPMLPMDELREAVTSVCAESGLSPVEGWVEKVLHLYRTKLTRHGVMIVGPSGTGKTTAWKVLMAAMVRLDRRLQMHAYVISPKVLNKAELFGTLDVTTREWRDGVLTSILRKIIDAEEQQNIPDEMALAGSDGTDTAPVEPLQRSGADEALHGAQLSTLAAADSTSLAPNATEGNTAPGGQNLEGKDMGGTRVKGDGGGEQAVEHKEHWIIFDGDVDPEWVENLNSVLDDNRLLTLPNGERLPLPRSVRLIFEVQDLVYATPATVSRCGMLWFSEGIVPLPAMLMYNYYQLQNMPVVDAHGRQLHWSYDDTIGVNNSRRGPLSGSVVAGGFGKVYHELVLTNTTGTTAGAMAGTTLQSGLGDKSDSSPRGKGTDQEGVPSALDTLNGSLHATGTINRSVSDNDAIVPESENVNDTVSMFTKSSAVGGNKAPYSGHPDAERIQEIMVGEWADAFEKTGMITRGLKMMKSPAFRDTCVMLPDDRQSIQSITSFLVKGIWRTFEAEQQNNGDVLSPATLKKVAMNVLIYAVFWGVASAMNLKSRAKLAEALGLRPMIGGVACSMVEVEVCYRTGEWQWIRNRVRETSILAEQVGANDTVITTVDTCRHEDVLSAWLSAGRSAILCGPPGSGKTMSITAVLNSLPEYEVVFLNFSSGTTVTTIMKALEQYCTVQDTARGLVMAPASGRRLLLFADEVNLPALDRYGTQVVVQLLRQLIERKGFFRARDNTWITVEDVQVVGACNPPTDPGRVPLSPRFLRWAPVLLVDFPSPESLLTIYTTYCRAILACCEQLNGDVATRLAQAMVKTYRASQAKFTPIQQPHYLYSPRELSRWTRALYEGFLTWDDLVRRHLSVSQLVRLAVHEGLRVFADRLVTAEEREWTNGTIVNAFREHFSEADTHTYDQPILFSTLLSRRYTDSSREELRAHVQKKLSVFNEEESVGDLVVYDAMIDHVVRIDRVLRQPLGHLLIAGSSGVGKTVLTRLVAWMRGFSTFSLMVHRNYDLEDFENDLRGVLRRAGCKRERICFMFDETNILQPSFLEYMNALLASGEVPGLFDGEEWPKLMQEIREAVLANQSYSASSHTGGGAKVSLSGAVLGGISGHAVESGGGILGARRAALHRDPEVNDDAGGDAGADGGRHTSSAAAASIATNAAKDEMVDVHDDTELYHWFLTNVRDYLHVVLTINPFSGEFTSRTVASPALVNRCTIDWFGDWDAATLQQVCKARIGSIPLLSACHGTFSKEVEVQDAVVESLCSIHVSTQHVNQALRVRHANQGSFVTPRHFTDCVSHFVTIFREKQQVSMGALAHLRSGLQKLQQTSTEVAAQQAALRDSEVQIEASSQRAQIMLERIVSETDLAKREKATAQELERQLQEEHSQISEDARQLSVELAEAEPALREADAALSTVKPEYLREIRAYSMPPPMVKRTLEAVAVLMGERNGDEWESLKNCIRRDDFMASVRTFRPDDISEPARERVRGMMRDSKFTVEAAYRASKAAGPLMQWVFFQVKYSAIYQRVAPMRSKIEELIKAREVKLKGLAVAQEQVREKERSLQQLMGEYQNATAQIAELKQRTLAISSRCERAQTVLRQLLDERDRWEKEMKNSDLVAHTTVGDCVISAVFLAYSGFYDEHTRECVLMQRWITCLQRANIPVRDGLSVTEYLSPASQQLAWEEAGLPKDRLNIDNAAIMHRCQRYVLVIDPTGVAANFLLRYYASKKITTASFSRSGYAKELEMAVRFGYPMLMEDAEHLDPAVSPLLNGELRCHGTRHVTRIGPHEVDLAPSFRLFLHTRNPNFQPPPDLAGQVCMVNFTVTLSSLQSQCLHYTLSHERPDVDEKRSNLLKMQGEYQLRLRVLEEKLLTRIAEAEGSLLDNDALIESLKELKDEAMRIAGDIASSEESMREIRGVEDMYRPIATVVAQAHFALQCLEELNPYYRYDVSFVLRVLEDALSALPPLTVPSTEGASEAVGATLRLSQLTYCIFVLLHRRVVRGLFQEDHLVWALRLAQLRSSMNVSAFKSSPNSPPLIASSLSTAGGFSGTRHYGEGSSVAPEEWEWIMECLRIPISSSEASGGVSSASSTLAPSRSNLADPWAALGDNSTSSAPLAALPPVVRRACPNLAAQGRQALGFLLSKPAFKEVRQTLSTQAGAWEAVLTSSAPVPTSESALTPECFPSGASRVRRLLLLSLILLNTRRDAFNEAVQHLLAEYFSTKEMGMADETVSTLATSSTSLFTEDFFAPQTNDLTEELMGELSASKPLLMVADTMFDPALRVEELAQRTHIALRVVAMGSMESMESANAYAAEAMKTGGWVLLKNIHFARSFMDKLERELHFRRSEGRLNSNFRLFLTAERDTGSSGAGAPLSKVLPINLIESSVMIVYEAPPGMQSSLLQTYGEYPAITCMMTSIGGSGEAESIADVSTEDDTALQRLCLAAAWLHSVVTERILYKPLGWSEAYEYTEVEYQRVVQAVRAWCQKRTALPDGTLSISWKALRCIVATTVYGGKMSNLFDQHILESFCQRWLCPEVLQDGAQLVSKSATSTSLPPPITGRTRAELLQWIHALPGGSSDPSWLALPIGADRMTRAHSALAVVERLSLVQGVLDDELTFSDVVEEGEEVVGVGAGRGTPRKGTLQATRWAATVRAYCLAWKPQLSDALEKLERHPFVQHAIALQEQENASDNTIASAASRETGGTARKSGGVAPPLVLAVQRESVAAVALVRHVAGDVQELGEVVMEERTPSSVHRALVDDLMKDHVPTAWAAHLRSVQGSASRSLFVGMWMADVQQRVAHLLALATAAQNGQLTKNPVRLGSLFSPGSFLTAFKQHCARAGQLPLEQLVPQVEVSQSATTGSGTTLVPRGADELVFVGLRLYSVNVDAAGRCALSGAGGGSNKAGESMLSTDVSLRWRWVASTTDTASHLTSLTARLAHQSAHQQRVLLPLYTTENRESLLEVLEVPAALGKSSVAAGVGAADEWYERGACLAAWTVFE